MRPTVSTFIDRLSGESVADPPSEILSGQLLVRGPVSLDREPETDGALIVDAGDPGVVVRVPHRGPQTLEVVQSSDPLTLKATVEIAEHIHELAELDDRWHEVAGACDPVVSKRQVGELLDRIPLELTVEGSLPELRQAYFEPEAELQFERLRIPVARARRISRKASQILAERSEDWLRMSASGVVPHRIESLVRHEVLDIYENRVAARLVDAIRAQLVRRLRLLEGLDELVRHEVVGWWRRQDRLATLWGVTFTDDALKDSVERRRRELLGVLGEVERLREGALYAGVPARARVTQPVRFTNLLTNDPNYRHVGKLWQEWWKSRGGEESTLDRRQRRLRETEAFIDFSLLLTCRALLGLGAPIEGSVRATLGPWGELTLAENDVPGCWTLTGSTPTGAQWTRSLVSLPSELPTSSEGEALRAIDLIERAAGNRQLILLYPATASDLRRLPTEAQTRAHYVPLEHGGVQQWRVPISPLDLESQERVEQVLRSTAVAECFETYPVSFDFPTRQRSIIDATSWLHPGDGDRSALLLAPPRPHEIKDLQRRIEREARREDARLAGAGRHDAAVLRETSARIGDLASRYTCLTTCPVCRSEGRFESREARTFECECPSCGSRWGLRHEPATDSRIPYLFVDDDGPEPRIAAVRWFGRDLVSLPCRSELRPYGTGVIDPRNGRCTEVPSVAATACDRCLPPAERVDYPSVD